VARLIHIRDTRFVIDDSGQQMGARKLLARSAETTLPSSEREGLPPG